MLSVMILKNELAECMIHTLRNAELMNRYTDPRHTAEQVTFHVKKICLQLRIFRNRK